MWIKIKNFYKQNLLLLAIIILASAIFLTNLGGQGYSLDEPQTVAIAKTILTLGYPSGWDGKVYLTAAGGTDFTIINGKNFWTWHPWLQFYLIAPFYFFFGNSITMLRFPFALIGVVTIAIFYLTIIRIFNNKNIAFLLSIQLIFLLPFFLYIRQIRYYSPSAVLSLILFYLFVLLATDKFNKKHLIIYFIAGLLLFLTNYIIWLSCLVPFVIFSIWKKNKFIIVATIFEIILGFLWFIFFMPYSGNPDAAYLGKSMFISSVSKYLSYTNNFILALAIVPLALFAAWKIKKVWYLWIISIWLVIKISIYSLLLDSHGRYLVDVMPIFLLFFGFIYVYLWEKRQVLAVILLAIIFTTTNIFSLLPTYLTNAQQKQFRFYPQAFLSELNGTYPTACIWLSDYLKKNAGPEDMFWSNYCGWVIYLYSEVPMFSSLCNVKTNKHIKSQDITEPDNVKWFIFFHIDSQKTPSLSTEPCLGVKWQKIMERNYTKKTFPLGPNTYNINDPDIVNRQFPPIRTAADTVIIYERN